MCKRVGDEATRAWAPAALSCPAPTPRRPGGDPHSKTRGDYLGCGPPSRRAVLPPPPGCRGLAARGKQEPSSPDTCFLWKDREGRGGRGWLPRWASTFLLPFDGFHTSIRVRGEDLLQGAQRILQAAKTSAAAAKSLQSCLTLCNPIDGSPPGAPGPGILQARTLEWVAIAFSNA